MFANGNGRPSVTFVFFTKTVKVSYHIRKHKMFKSRKLKIIKVAFLDVFEN